LPFGSFVFNHPAFLSGKFDTHFVKKFYTAEKIKDQQQANANAAAIVAVRYWMELQKITKPVENESTGWKRRQA
jgi:acetyl/propionyl-CoA carboxylase alpha subunit